MAKTAVVLGPVSFREFEVPEHLHKVSGYLYATHRLGSGGEVIDGVGPEEGYVGFSGVFTGSDARDRCVLLDSLRASGLVIPLIWPGNYCTVVIRKLSLDFHQPAWIPYRILCSVIWSLDSVILSLESSPAQVMAEDSASVSELLSGTGVVWDGTPRMAALNTPVSPVSATADLRARLDRGLVEIERTYSSAAAKQSVDQWEAPGRFEAVLAASETLYRLTTARGYAGRIQANQG